jgi:hypothetical protein
MLVYNPDDEPVDYRFAGSPVKQLPANGKVNLPDNEARFVAQAFGKFGVTALVAGLPEDEQIKDAEKRYIKGTREWAETVLVEWYESTKTKRELKMKLEEPPDVVTARTWLQGRGFMEK